MMEPIRSGSMGRSSLEARRQHIQIAETEKRIQLRMMKANRYGPKQSHFVRRNFVLFMIYLATIFDVSFALIILVSAITGLDWLNLKVCNCAYRCEDEFRLHFTALKWNVTFTPNQCSSDDDMMESEVWNCQVQSTWSTCVCNQVGSDVNGNLLLNVADCGFYKLTSSYLLIDVLIIIFGVVISSAMFKLSQYSPDNDKVSFTNLVCRCVPESVQRLFNAHPQESKTYFFTFYTLYLTSWIIEVPFLALQVSNFLITDEQSRMPKFFMKVQTLCFVIHLVVFLFQGFALYKWIENVERHFRVMPRLHTIKRARELDNGIFDSIYICDDISNAQHREKIKKMSRSVGHASPKSLLTSFGRFGGRRSLDDGLNNADLNNDFDQFFSNEGSQIVENSPLFVNVITNIGQRTIGAKDDDLVHFKFKLDYVDKMGCATIPSNELIPLVTFYCHIDDENDDQIQQDNESSSDDSVSSDDEKQLGLIEDQDKFGALRNSKKRKQRKRRKLRRKLGNRKSREIVCKLINTDAADWTFCGINYQKYFASCYGFYARHNFELKLERKLILGRHRLDIRQPLASSSRIRHVDKVLAQVEIKNAASGERDLAGSDSDPEAQLTRDSLSEYEWANTDIDQAEEFDSMLEACEYHEVTDIIFIDPQFDKKTFNHLRENMEEVRKKMREIGPDLESIFKKFGDEAKHSEEVERIRQEECLYDYFILLQMRIVGTSSACIAIGSNMVQNIGDVEASSSGVRKGKKLLKFLGKNCGLPFAGAAVSLICGVSDIVEEHTNKLRVENLRKILPTPKQTESIAEKVALKMVKDTEEEIRKLHAMDIAQNNPRSKMDKLIRNVKKLVDYAVVAEANTKVKYKASEDASKLLDYVMSGDFNKEMKSRYTNRQQQQQQHAGGQANQQASQSLVPFCYSEEELVQEFTRFLQEVESNDENLTTLLSQDSFEQDESDFEEEVDSERRSNQRNARESIVSLQQELEEARRFLKGVDGPIDFTRTSVWTMTTKTYRLRLEDRGLPGGGLFLVWRSGTKSIEKEISITSITGIVTDPKSKSRTKIKLTGSDGKDELFTFRDVQTAVRFKNCLQLLWQNDGLQVEVQHNPMATRDSSNVLSSPRPPPLSGAAALISSPQQTAHQNFEPAIHLSNSTSV